MYPMPHYRPLLCEFHAHTTWSDGVLALPELVDLYGRVGFDVLAVTDHVLSSAHEPYGWHDSVGAERFADYVREIDVEAQRALEAYGMLVIPGAELSLNDTDPDLAAHAVAVGLRSFVSLDDGLEPALCTARAAGAALIAAHPHATQDDPTPGRTTRRFFVERDELAVLVDRFELFNRNTLFPWISELSLPFVACGDFHRPRHLDGWKTLLPCELDEAAVVAYLRSQRPAFLTRLAIGLTAEVPQAA